MNIDILFWLKIKFSILSYRRIELTIMFMPLPIYSSYRITNSEINYYNN